MSFVDTNRGTRRLTRHPINDMEKFWSPSEKGRVLQMLSRSVAESFETVRAGHEKLAKAPGANELIVVLDIYDHARRLCSLELNAEAATVDPTVNDLVPPTSTQSKHRSAINHLMGLLGGICAE